MSEYSELSIREKVSLAFPSKQISNPFKFTKQKMKNELDMAIAEIAERVTDWRDLLDFDYDTEHDGLRFGEHMFHMEIDQILEYLPAWLVIAYERSVGYRGFKATVQSLFDEHLADADIIIDQVRPLKAALNEDQKVLISEIMREYANINFRGDHPYYKQEYDRTYRVANSIVLLPSDSLIEFSYPKLRREIERAFSDDKLPANAVYAALATVRSRHDVTRYRKVQNWKDFLDNPSHDFAGMRIGHALYRTTPEVVSALLPAWLILACELPRERHGFLRGLLYVIDPYYHDDMPDDISLFEGYRSRMDHDQQELVAEVLSTIASTHYFEIKSEREYVERLATWWRTESHRPIEICGYFHLHHGPDEEE